MDDFPSLFRLAKNISKHSDYKVQMGAVLVAHGKPISVGYNKIKSHPEYYPYSMHAEVSALQTSGREHIKNTVMYIYRENRSGELAIARPCPNCMCALREFGVRKIYYTVSDFPYFRVETI